jgi:uncharacterized protein HemY
MTGPEHYAKAEEYLEKASGSLNTEYEGYVVRAQVHATLALAAATALGNTMTRGLDQDAWEGVASIWKHG